MKRSLLILIVIMISISAMNAQINNNGLSASNSFLRNPDFWMSTSVNLMGTALFISRVHYPNSAKWFGYVTQLLGVPAFALSWSDISKGQTDLATWGNMGYAVWAFGSVLIDYVFKVEYRDPVKLGIIIPYVTGYYIAIGFQSAAQYENGLLPWAIAGTACIVNTAASLYAHKKGTDFKK